MSRKELLTPAAFIAGICFAVLAISPAPAQVTQTPRVAGKYQVVCGGSANTIIVMIDTETGHCWTKASGTTWHDEGTPVK